MRKLLLTLLVLPVVCLGFTYTIDPAQVELKTSHGYTRPVIAGAGDINEPGSPALPWLPLQIATEAGMGTADVHVVNLRTIELPGFHVVFPTQQARPISQPGDFVENFDQAVYAADTPYPAEPLRAAGGGNLAGHGVAGVNFCPFIYHPDSGKLELITEITFTIEYESLPYSVRRPAALTPRVAEANAERVRNLVINPEAVGLPAPVVEPNVIGRGYEPLEDEPDYGDTAEWVLITDESMVDAFEPLAEWKLQKGLTTAIVTTQFIADNYSGVDAAEKIRNFIIDAFENWSTQYVVLGGDCNMVRERRGWVTYYTDDDTSRIPCDYYYSDLDGDWNADGDDKWGEWGSDNVDLYADVHVSRLPAQNATEAEGMVDKVLVYEQSIPADFPLTTLFFAGRLDSNPTWGGDGKDYVADELPSQFLPYSTFYERDMTYNAADIIVEYEAGNSAVVNQLHHSSYTVIGAGYDYIYTSDAMSMSNGDYSGWIYLQGCMCGGFDRSRSACEGLVVNADGGSVASMCNSRYGLYQPGSPEYGPSNVLDKAYFEGVFTEGLTAFGAAQSYSKDYFVPQAGNTSIRWCMYVQNVLGPCETPSWTDTPYDLVVDHPDTLDGYELTVSVDDTTRAAVNGATVCLFIADMLHKVDYTDAAGEVTFDLSSDPLDGDITITVTAPNRYYYQGYCSVVSTDSDVAEFNGSATEEGALISWRLEDGADYAGLHILRDGERLTNSPLERTAGSYLDRQAAGSADYYLELIDHSGRSTEYGPVTVVLPETSGVRALSAAYPNPARDAVSLELNLPESENVNVAVYDLSGRRVATLTEGELSAGRHLIAWNCAAAPEGLYLVRLVGEAGVLTSRLVIAR
ncbi:MAG: T9SS type A sorting domain-containing protein [Candidatus Coatesbacteria bacterium]|nr:T9SS type A sorting domain-containing protein [Candidatus Coatesbacteria bacterium]